MRRPFGIALSLLLILAAGPTTADTKARRDGDDLGRLDIRRLRHGHADKSRLKHSLNMDGTWKNRLLRGRHRYIYFWLSTDAEERFAERRIVVDYKRGRLVAWMESYEEESDAAGIQFLGFISVSRPSRSSVSVRFRRQLLGESVDQYSWSALSIYRSPRTLVCRPACDDDAPKGRGRGRIVHALT